MSSSRHLCKIKTRGSSTLLTLYAPVPLPCKMHQRLENTPVFCIYWSVLLGILKAPLKSMMQVPRLFCDAQQVTHIKGSRFKTEFKHDYSAKTLFLTKGLNGAGMGPAGDTSTKSLHQEASGFGSGWKQRVNRNCDCSVHLFKHPGFFPKPFPQNARHWVSSGCRTL